MGQTVTQAVVTAQAAVNPRQKTQLTALFDSAGNPVVPNAPAAVITASLVGTVAKVASAYPLPAANSIVPIKFTNGNTAAAVTIAFATGGARPILLGGTAPTANELQVAANGVVLFWFDGTSLHQLGAMTVTA